MLIDSEKSIFEKMTIDFK